MEVLLWRHLLLLYLAVGMGRSAFSLDSPPCTVKLVSTTKRIESRIPSSTSLSSDYTTPGSSSSSSLPPPPPLSSPLPLPTLTPVTAPSTSQIGTVSSPGSTPYSSNAVPDSSNIVPGPSPSSESQSDKNFHLLLYTVPPTGFVVIVVILLFIVLCIRRYWRLRRYRHHLHMPLEEMDSSSEGSGSEGGEDEEMTERESREAAFVVNHARLHTQPVLAFKDDEET